MPRALAMSPVAAALRRPALAPPRALVARPLAVRNYAAVQPRSPRSARKAEPKRADMRISDATKAFMDSYKGGNTPLVPTTLVALPWRLQSKRPSVLLRYSWVRMKAWAVEISSLMRVKLQSMDGWSRPKFKAQRRKIPLAAKVMYREVLEAFANGDQSTIKKLCTSQYAAGLQAAIDRRKPDVNTHFQVLRYNSAWRYPRLAAYHIFPSVLGDGAQEEQAVVAIASRQQTHKTDAKTGQTIDNTYKVKDLLEYVVLTRGVDPKTWAKGPWRVWGTTDASGLQEYETRVKKFEEDMAKNYHFAGRRS